MWQATAAADRNALLLDWLSTYNATIARLAAASPPLRFAAALPFWLDTYYDEPLHVTPPGAGGPQLLYQRMAQLMRPGDVLQLMSCAWGCLRGGGRALQGCWRAGPGAAAALSTCSPRGVAQPCPHSCAPLPPPLHPSADTTRTDWLPGFVGTEMAYAAGLSPAPCVMAGLETGTGVGSGTSYGDTAGKASKAVVLADIAALSATLAASYPASFCGFNVHDWGGWRALPP